LTTTFFNSYFDTLSKKAAEIDTDLLEQAATMISQIDYSSGAKSIIAGNGGSASIASHVAVDLTKAANARSICFNEANLITCYANDYGYEKWVEEAIKSYYVKGDVVILISSSGTSKNIVNAATYAKNLGLNVITFSGFSSNNDLRKIGDINLWIDSSEYNIVEITHNTWLLSIVERVIQLKKS
jgi:D-sedoheptulose 7-phosphate isomerase